MIIGLTGLFGSGKSEVATIWRNLGAHIINADEIGREVVEHNPVVLYRLVLEFGSTILDGDHKLDRRQLGRLAFSSQEKTKILNSIVHPILLEQLSIRIKEARQKKFTAAVDAALLINWGFHRRMDCTVLVTSTRLNRYERLRHNGFSDEEIKVRTRSQLSESRLRRCADCIITNNKDLESLKRRAQILYCQLTERG